MRRPGRWQVRNNLFQNITPDKVFINTMHLRIKQFHHKKYAKRKRLILVSLQYRWLQTSGELKPDIIQALQGIKKIESEGACFVRDNTYHRSYH